MLKHTSIRNVPLRDAEGRQTHYIMQPGNWQMTDPFLLWADVRYPHGYFADHPHKGIQTATYVLDGAITHYDNFSGNGRLETGDFQIMTAGNGIIHNEDPDAGTTARVLQLWINLSPEHKKLHASYIDILHSDAPTYETQHAKINVLAGKLYDVNHVNNPTPIHIYHGQTTGKIDIPVTKGFNSYLYIVDGTGTVSGEAVDQFDVVHFEETTKQDHFTIDTDTALTFFFISGQPIKAPVVAAGPFVMNTEQELYEAFKDYESGQFIEKINQS